MKKKKLHGLKKTAITAGMGVFMAATIAPLVSAPIYAAAYQPDYPYPPVGKGGVHVSDEAAPATDITNANGDVVAKDSGTDFYVAVWDVDPNDPETACKGWFHVVDQDGNPIPNITFSLCRNDNSARIYEPWNGKGSVTDSEGDLLFYVPEGDYTVILQTPTGYETFHTEIYPMRKGENEYTIVLKKKTGGNNGGNNNGGNNNGGNNNGGNNGGSSSGGGSSSNKGNTETKPQESQAPGPQESTPTPAPTPTPSPKPSLNPTPNPTPQPSAPSDQKPETEKGEEKEEINLPGKDGVIGTEDDITVRPGKDQDGNNNATIDKDGKITLPDGGTVIHPSIPDQGKIGIDVPKGTIVYPNGVMDVPKGMLKRYTLPGKDAMLDTEDDVQVVPQLGKDGRDSSLLREDGSVFLPDGGTVTYADGEVIVVPPETVILPDGTIIYPEDEEVPDEPFIPADAGAHDVHFGDCWFHWLEILVMLLMTIASLIRLSKIRRVHKELDEMEPEDKRNETKE